MWKWGDESTYFKKKCMVRMVCMYVCSAIGQHPAVGNMGMLCRRMLRVRKERAALLTGQVREGRQVSLPHKYCPTQATFFFVLPVGSLGRSARSLRVRLSQELVPERAYGRRNGSRYRRHTTPRPR